MLKIKNFIPHCPEALRYAKVWGRASPGAAVKLCLDDLLVTYAKNYLKKKKKSKFVTCLYNYANP